MLEFSEQQREALITEYLPHAKRLSRKLCREGQELDEVEGQAYLGLVAAVDKLICNGLHHDNVGGYITQYIKRYIYETDRTQQYLSLNPADLPGKSRGDMSFLDDIIKTELEAEVCRLLIMDYTLQEIAGTLDIGVWKLQQVRNTLKERIRHVRSRL